jgi:hypothetical protein
MRLDGAPTNKLIYNLIETIKTIFLYIKKLMALI